MFMVDAHKSIFRSSEAVGNVEEDLLEGGLVEGPVFDISRLQLGQHRLELVVLAPDHYVFVFDSVEPANYVSLSILLLQLQGCPLSNHSPLRHYHNAVRYAFRLFHVVGCDQDCVLLPQLQNQFPSKQTYLSVHACCWLVEDDQLRGAD